MKKFLLIIAAIFCCTLGANAQTPDYFCIRVDSGGTITKYLNLKVNGTLDVTPKVEYRINDGKWNNWSSSNNFTVNVNDKVYFRAGENGAETTNASFSKDDKNYIYVYVSGIPKYSVSGNIMSLLDGKDFETLDAVPNYAFYRLFNSGSSNNTNLTDISDLRLPATTLAEGCYAYMFSRCTNITIAPTLPATELKKQCYYYMFYGCSNLKSIEVNFTKWPQTMSTYATDEDYQGTYWWVYDVPNTGGEFICPAELPQTSSSDFGSSRIPGSSTSSHWTIYDVTPEISLNDGEPFTRLRDRTMNVTYNRHFDQVATDAEHPVFYPLYVPFDIEITADLLEKCEILDIYMVSAGSGSNKGKDVLNVRAMEEGETTKFHTPYIIIPKVADFSFTQENTVVHGISAVQKPVQCATTKDTYDFIGSYSGETLTVGTDFILTPTKLLPVDEDTKILAPNRWYMKKTSKMDEEPVSIDLKEMNIVVIGEGGATGIEGVSLTPALSEGEGAMYNLQGQRVKGLELRAESQGYRGIVICNGKKYILK